MYIFKPSYKDKAGKAKQAAHWYVETKDHLERRLKVKGFRYKPQTEALGRMIEKLIVSRCNNAAPDKEQSAWLANCPARIRDRLADFGLIDKSRSAAAKPLKDHISDFIASRYHTKTGHSAYTKTSLNRAFDGAGFRYWQDISGSKLVEYLAGYTSVQRTYNFYLKTCKTFCKWMIRDGRAAENPIEYLDAIQNTDKKIVRRALSVAEIQWLLTTTPSAPDYRGTTGTDRCLLYQFAIETGLRANEIRTLNVAAFGADFSSVKLESKNTKNRKEYTLPIRPGTAAKLRDYLAGKHPAAPAFSRVPRETSKMIHRDLDHARNQWQKEYKQKPPADFCAYEHEGRRVDFHALRHTFGSLLAASGTHPKTAMQLMRHSSIELTMNIYTHSVRELETAAVNALPDFETAQKQAAEKA